MANEKVDVGIAIAVLTALIAFGEKIFVFLKWLFVGKKKEVTENEKITLELDEIRRGGMAKELKYWQDEALKERQLKEQALMERDSLKKEMAEFEKRFMQLQVEFQLLTIKANSLI